MNDDWASEHLHTIRTLMERTALYRRTLAPVSMVTGAIGTVAAWAGWTADFSAPHLFATYWLALATVAVMAAVLLIRRQALGLSEPFWSPPMRRVVQAMLPALVAGLALGLTAALQGWLGSHHDGTTAGLPPSYWANMALPLAWTILYGCAVHAAGFFMQRGIRLFAWLLIICGCLGFCWREPQTRQGLVDAGYLIMGLVFGVLHLGYSLYLFASEKRSSAE
jgi:hypothetical protein